MKRNISDWIDKEITEISGDPFFKILFATDFKKPEDASYLTSKSNGIELVLSTDKTLSSVHLFSGKNGIYDIYKYDLPLNLSFSLSRKDIEKKLGIPNKTGGGHNDLHLGYIAFWDKYYFDRFSLHLQYSTDKSIDMITIASLSLEEYFNIGLQ